ncbi:MAG: hypothetical protein JRI25_12005 [Deltaproteobacteria bacterium]|nr:hypothetical protein [Deltaproteobacteria bacterium]MBW2255308.1 hypothetical protein [Deltaproteobacteria bacterium]
MSRPDIASGTGETWLSNNDGGRHRDEGGIDLHTAPRDIGLAQLMNLVASYAGSHEERTEYMDYIAARQ